MTRRQAQGSSRTEAGVARAVESHGGTGDPGPVDSVLGDQGLGAQGNGKGSSVGAVPAAEGEHSPWGVVSGASEASL